MFQRGNVLYRVLDNHPMDSRIGIKENNIFQTMGTRGGRSMNLTRSWYWKKGYLMGMQEHKIRYCAYCQKPMERKRLKNGELQSWLHYNRQTYCNKECMKAAFRAKPKKGTSWMTVHYHARNLLPDGCCEICGSNQNVDVHHKDGNPQNNSIENLQRLCRSCHIKIHHPQKYCLICGAKVKGLGYCNKHYIRYKKYGNPLLVNGREVME